jgi:hypothetical protein
MDGWISSRKKAVLVSNENTLVKSCNVPRLNKAIGVWRFSAFKSSGITTFSSNKTYDVTMRRGRVTIVAVEKQ